MQLLRALLWCLAALALSGCHAVYRDVSAQHSPLINRHIRATEALLVHAVATTHFPAKVVDVYYITRKPGFGGREVVFRKELSPGARFRILRAEECSNCVFGDFQFVVEPLSGEYADHPVVIPAGRSRTDFTALGFEVE